MQWKAFFHRSTRARVTTEHFGPRQVQLWELRCRNPGLDCFGITRLRCRLNCGFGQYVHSLYLRRHSELTPHLLGAYDRSLAAYPAFLAVGKFGWKDQHQLDLGSHFHLRLAVEEDAAAAHVARPRRMFHSMRGSHACRDAGRYSFPGAALSLGCHNDSQGAHQIYTKPASLLRVSGPRRLMILVREAH